jgi:uncharacterized protein (TIGR00251 family)
MLPVLAHAGARRNAILGERAGALRVAVTSPPERGKANAAIQSLLAESLGVKPRQISLISGETSRQKQFLIEGITPTDLLARLAAIVVAANSND